MTILFMINTAQISETCIFIIACINEFVRRWSVGKDRVNARMDHSVGKRGLSSCEDGMQVRMHGVKARIELRKGQAHARIDSLEINH